MARFLDISIFWRNRTFSLLYGGQFISFIGTMMLTVAMPFQIYVATHSTVMVGLLSLAQLVPLLFTALIGGVFADRHSRRYLLIISECVLAACCVALAINASYSIHNITLIFLLASFMSAVTGLHRPAFDGLIQQIVRKEDYKTIGALHAFQFSFCMITAPAIAGFMIASIGVAIIYWLALLALACSLLAILWIQDIPKPGTAKPTPVFTALKEGIQFAWSRPILWGSYSVDFLAMVFAIPNALFPAMALKWGGAKILGLLYAAPAVGALIMSIWSGWTAAIEHEGQAIAIAAVAWGCAIIGFGLSHSFLPALLFLTLAGAADAVSGIFRVSLWNNSIPHEFRGRLAGIEMLSYLSGPKLGDTRAGLMAQFIGIGPAIISGGILCILGVGLCCYRLREFWHYKSNTNQYKQ